MASEPSTPALQPLRPTLTVGGAVAPLALSQVDIVDSRRLLGAKGELQILHGNRVYRLRVTMSGKLILTA